MVTPDAKRKAVVHACEVHGVSQRRACQALRIDRSTVRYTSVRPDDAPLREAMKAVAAEPNRRSVRAEASCEQSPLAIASAEERDMAHSVVRGREQQDGNDVRSSTRPGMTCKNSRPA